MKDKLVAIEDAVLQLGVCDEDLTKWIKNEAIECGFDHRARRAIHLSDVKNFAESKEYDSAILKSFHFEKDDKFRVQIDKKNHSFAIDKNIKILHFYIEKLKLIHQYYLSRINSCGFESAEMAAYLLFSRVISTMNMCCLCATNRYWYWGSHIREIDEALDLAFYFMLIKAEEIGRDELREWFRLNNAPAHSKCRKKISEYHSSVNPQYSKDDNEGLMSELYHKKSKFTHPTFCVIREITEFEVSSESIMLKKIDYGCCTYDYKIRELVDFFGSSIVTASQYFLSCFRELPLLHEHIRELRVIINYFLQ